jgi:hypothetical protein
MLYPTTGTAHDIGNPGVEDVPMCGLPPEPAVEEEAPKELYGSSFDGLHGSFN